MSCRKDSCKSAKCSYRVAVHVRLQECTCARHMPNVHVWLGKMCVYMYVCVQCTVCSWCSNVLGVGVASFVCVCVCVCV